MNKRWLTFAGLTAGALAMAGHPLPAAACGCFTPPDPTVPIVQAGERLLFAIDGGQVTAHIQIQYSGEAQEFGWLLPLPSVPALELGTDEVFNDLITQTQPKYRLKRVFNGACNFAQPLAGFGAQNSPTAGGEDGTRSQDPSPLLIAGSTGPYDWAVLKADSKDDMLSWLAANRYFVPAGTDDVVAPYIHPGAYFLALKLRPGQKVGDLQPVVVHYASDLPMIPIVLSSVTAARNLGIQVWMLGEGRAIPRNYYHTVINDAAVDWLTAGQNYNDVIIKASGEAPKHHTFVTEYAGSSGVMKGQLDFPGRFGDQTELGSQPDAVAFTSYMTQHGYPFNGQVTTILGDYIPFPSGIAATGISAAQYYQNLGYYLGQYKAQHPSVFERYTFRYDGPAMADELTQRVATPTRAASALFDAHPYLTRLYTTLSPEDMSEDPVFSYNPGLPDISNVHEATLTYECSYLGSSNQNDTFAWLRTADGFTIGYPNGTAGASSPLATLPASRQIQILREAGDPEVVTDNTGAISGALGQGGGCSVALGDATRRSAPVGLAVMVLLGLAVARRRSRGR